MAGRLVYCWNPSNVPQAALRVLADEGLPIAFRVCDHSLNGLFIEDQFMRELLPRRGPGRAGWSLACRSFNGPAGAAAQAAGAPAGRDLLELGVHPLERQPSRLPRTGARAGGALRFPDTERSTNPSGVNRPRPGDRLPRAGHPLQGKPFARVKRHCPLR